jgi:hypothetical protein
MHNHRFVIRCSVKQITSTLVARIQRNKDMPAQSVFLEGAFRKEAESFYVLFPQIHYSFQMRRTAVDILNSD